MKNYYKLLSSLQFLCQSENPNYKEEIHKIMKMATEEIHKMNNDKLLMIANREALKYFSEENIFESSEYDYEILDLKNHDLPDLLFTVTRNQSQDYIFIEREKCDIHPKWITLKEEFTDED